MYFATTTLSNLLAPFPKSPDTKTRDTEDTLYIILNIYIYIYIIQITVITIFYILIADF